MSQTRACGRVTPAAAARAFDATVAGLVRRAADVTEVILAPPAGADFSWRPGQYLSLLLEDGRRRSFSMACRHRPGGRIELHVRRRPGGRFSDDLLPGLKLGDRLRVEGPYGEVDWRPGDGPVVLMGTGTGLAPLKALLEHGLAEATERRIHLYWGGRTPADLYLDAPLRRLAREHRGFTFTPLLSRPHPAWRGRRGYVQDAVAEDFADLHGADVYACGAPAMIDAARARLAAVPGFDAGRFLTDAFEPAEAPSPPGSAASLSIFVGFEGAARPIAAAGGGSLLAALQAAGAPVLSVCGGKASCGACRVFVEAAWRDRLAPAERTERRLLAHLDEAGPHDRLACQVQLTPAMDGLAVRLAPKRRPRGRRDPQRPQWRVRMTDLAMEPDLEAVGATFDEAKMLFVRERTRSAIHEIAARVKPGMVEEDAVEMAKDLLADLGMLKGWHDVYVRFGANTLKTFGAASDPGVVLGENDIFFIDIGPVWQAWEGDGGDTFVVGRQPEMERCAADARTLFHKVRHAWAASGLSGKALYDFAIAEAQTMGWELNMDLSGHRICDFPHEAVYPGPLAEVDFKPKPLLWVLEIHIRDPGMRFGAFFEDMLLADSYFEA